MICDKKTIPRSGGLLMIILNTSIFSFTPGPVITEISFLRIYIHSPRVPFHDGKLGVYTVACACE